jgi:hypothetical protein
MRILGSAVLGLSAGAAWAGAPVAVPEIDAGAGVVALAALGAGIALVWERWRKR